MYTLDEKIKKAIGELKRDDLGIVYIYGSFAEGEPSELSDIDIGIVLTQLEILNNPIDSYNEFFKTFSNVIDEPYDLDISLLQNSTLELQYEVICRGRVVYAITQEFKDNYEENIINNYLDFSAVREIFDRALTERFKL